MMETSAFAEANAFDFTKTPFTDEEIKSALIKDMESAANAFTMADGSSFDCSGFFPGGVTHEDQSKLSRCQDAQPMPDEPVDSIEKPSKKDIDAVAVAAKEEVVASPTVYQDSNGTMAPERNEKSTVKTTLSSEGPSITGLKHDSTDPLLFNCEGLENFFASGNPATLPPFEEPTCTMPKLASPFQPPTQRHDTTFDLPVDHMDPSVIGSHCQMPMQQHLSPQQGPLGRRRSHTAPPDFEPDITSQHRFVNGPQGLISRQMRPHLLPPSQNGVRFRLRYPLEQPPMMSIPHSYPVTPPPAPRQPVPLHHPHHQQGYMSPTLSRPQSLNPDLRMSLMNRGREISPDHRAKKRQKTSNEPRVQNVDSDGFGLDSAMVGVKFLLRDAVEKGRYRRDEEVERLRAESRAQNAMITSLETPLAPVASKVAPPSTISVPKTGLDIRELNTQSVQALLDFYDVPFVSTMFLHDKKLLYLGFLGASGCLKHLVLD